MCGRPGETQGERLMDHVELTRKVKWELREGGKPRRGCGDPRVKKRRVMGRPKMDRKEGPESP